MIQCFFSAESRIDGETVWLSVDTAAQRRIWCCGSQQTEFPCVGDDLGAIARLQLLHDIAQVGALDGVVRQAEQLTDLDVRVTGRDKS